MHSVHSRSTQKWEILLCYRAGYLKLPLQLHLSSLPVHLRGGQGKNTAQPSGSIKGKVQHGLCLCISFLRTTTTISPISCAWICSSTPDPLRPQRGKTHSVYIQSSERSLEGKLCFLAHWPQSYTAGHLLKGSQLTTQALLGDERAQSSPYPWIDSAAFATSKPLRHSRGAPTSLKPYPFHKNFHK